MTRRALRYGALIAVAYVATIALTLRGTGHHVRPLFEGIGPSTPYHWVDPPPEFAAGNVAPAPAEADIALEAGGSKVAGPSTPDGQVVLAMPGGAVAPQPPDTSVHVEVTPLAPDTLGDVPPNLRPDGNAYQIELVYQPSGEPVAQLAKPGNVILVVPEPAAVILFSPDGDAWTSLETQQVGGAATTTVGARLERPGFYLGAALPASATDAPSSGNDAGSILAVAAATAALALGIGFAPGAVRRLRGGRNP